MVATSPVCSIRYPELTDAPNIPTHIQNMATDLDDLCIPKFANVSARDTAIPSPTDGQHCYITGEDKLYFYHATQWIPYYQDILYTKTANELLGNSTTFQNDNHLLNIVLKANTVYFLNGEFMVQNPAAADWKVKMVFDVAPVGDNIWCMQRSETGNEYFTYTATNAQTQLDIATQGAPFVDFISIQGVFQTGGSPTTIDFQWAKLNSDAGTTTVYGGSYVQFTEAS